MSDGLREALEELVRDRENTTSLAASDYVIAPYEVRDLLAAHPVEPARGAAETVEAVRRMFNHLANGDYDGQVGMGFAATFDQHLDAILEEAAASPVRGIAEGGGITDEAVEQVAKALFAHSERDAAYPCEWENNFATKNKWRALARTALEAAPLLGLQQVPTVLLDREAVEHAIATKVMYYDSSTAVHEVDDNDLAGLTAGVDAVMELAQQVPSREEIAEALSNATRDMDYRKWETPHGMLPFADAVLALFSKPAEPLCGKPGPRHHGPCVFTPGHHDGFHNGGEWTSHGDRGGWTWNDQPAEEGS